MGKDDVVRNKVRDFQGKVRSGSAMGYNGSGETGSALVYNGSGEENDVRAKVVDTETKALVEECQVRDSQGKVRFVGGALVYNGKSGAHSQKEEMEISWRKWRFGRARSVLGTGDRVHFHRRPRGDDTEPDPRRTVSSWTSWTGDAQIRQTRCLPDSTPE